MNIETTQKISQTQSVNTTKNCNTNDSNANFADELKTLESDNIENSKDTTKKTEPSQEKTSEKELNTEINQTSQEENTDKNTADAIDGLEGIVEQMAQINFSDEPPNETLKNSTFFDDKKNKNEVNGLIDNNMNIQEPKEHALPEMNSNMNFNSNGQPFSEFVNPQNDKQTLKTSAKDIAEENAILSTMEENIAIANKNISLKEQQKTKTVTNNEGIKKVDAKTNITVDTIVNYDNVIMDKSDVEFFANLVSGDITNLSEIQNPEKSAAVSKTLADLLAKSMEDNKPIRINFDNDISVIIRVDREGKISADFLPSSQIAEAYLKENLPLLRQRFDDNNIEYNELNQRKQKQDDNSQNRKKGSKDE